MLSLLQNSLDQHYTSRLTWYKACRHQLYLKYAIQPGDPLSLFELAGSGLIWFVGILCAALVIAVELYWASMR